MSTEAQISANQINSEKSAGPKTESGKATSSQNSWKHGLSGGVFTVLSTESQFKYQDLLEHLLGEYQPPTPSESILVERMAQHHWLRNRALAYQNQLIEAAPSMGELNTALFTLFQRYETTHERAYRQCMNDVLKLRSERLKLEIGFASQTQKTELHRIAIRSREAEAEYQQTRLSLVQHDAYRQEKRFAAAAARENRVDAIENQEADLQKAA